jgi:hypothetical protein
MPLAASNSKLPVPAPVMVGHSMPWRRQQLAGAPGPVDRLGDRQALLAPFWSSRLGLAPHAWN